MIKGFFFVLLGKKRRLRNKQVSEIPATLSRGGTSMIPFEKSSRFSSGNSRSPKKSPEENRLDFSSNTSVLNGGGTGKPICKGLMKVTFIGIGRSKKKIYPTLHDQDKKPRGEFYTLLPSTHRPLSHNFFYLHNSSHVLILNALKGIQKSTNSHV